LFLGLFLLFTYGHLNNILVDLLPEAYAKSIPQITLSILGIVVIILGFKKIWLRFGGANRVTPLLNLVLIFAVLSQVLLGSIELVKRLPAAALTSGRGNGLPDTGIDVNLDCTIRPDIYLIILDGYGRADALKEVYGVDTGGFLESLESKGFYIADQSHSNYIQTVYSIPSTLNFRYMDPMPAEESGYEYFPALVANNQAMALLRQCGYKMVTFNTGFTFTNYPEADVYFSLGSGLNEYEELFLASTPLDGLVEKVLVKPPDRGYDAHRARVQYTFEKLAELPRRSGPKFVYAHIISPHPPFVFDAEGNPVQPNRSYSIGDGDDYRGTWKEYRSGYAQQVQYVNKLLDETLSSIISRSASPPVIIIQGDHGPGGLLVWKSPDLTCLWSRTAILNAYYLPDSGSRDLFPDITPVNSLRVVLNTYFKANLPLLPGETYFTSHKPGGAFVDVTDRQDSRANCGLETAN
jgi:hypothetical protein